MYKGENAGVLILLVLVALWWCSDLQEKAEKFLAVSIYASDFV